MDSNDQTRRQFCVRTCQLLALGGAVAATLESCASGSPTSANGLGGVSALPTVSGTLSGSTITVSTVSGTPLATVGTLALVTTGGGDVLVARTDASTFMALSAGCTHQSCEITGFSGQIYVCPCHGSRFDTSGRVVNGPAVSPLPQFQTQFSNDVLTITA